MNQILVTQKLYITPELKRKKNMYKIYFCISVFLMCVLISAGIYAEYDRNKGEGTSQEILGNFNSGMEENLMAQKKALIVILDDAEQTEQIAEENKIEEKAREEAIANDVKTTATGYQYKTIANISIPKINVNYAITDGQTHSIEETEALLKESPTKFWGANPNEAGNFCIVGHNYRNKKFVSKVPTLENGDIIEITDNKNRKLQYFVYDKYEVVPEDVDCLTQPNDDRVEITLITCTNDSQKRVIVKAKAK